jgi:integrase
LNAGKEKSTYTAIRSFYKHCKAKLPSYPINFKDKTALKPIVSQQPITLDEMRQLLTNAKPREQAMFLIQQQTGMDRSTFAECFNLYS